ncbi:hypothetical protein [Gymnodinialimonas sp.]
MTTAKTTPAKPAQGTQTDVTITLSQEVLAKLRKQVKFETVSDLRELVADAINTYVQLGQLRASDAEILARQGPDGKLVRLHFPFDPNPAAAATDESEA